ncbi:MAG: hypothetical protein GMKNLPBB_02736 [Myxococcota bacterium]|nr:hypothetical protein [Myxococcota bacterium]
MSFGQEGDGFGRDCPFEAIEFHDPRFDVDMNRRKFKLATSFGTHRVSKELFRAGFYLAGDFPDQTGAMRLSVGREGFYVVLSNRYDGRGQYNLVHSTLDFNFADLHLRLNLPELTLDGDTTIRTHAHQQFQQSRIMFIWPIVSKNF